MDDLDLKQYVRTIMDFPQAGIAFRDITTLLKEPAAFRAVIDRLVEPFVSERIDVVVGMESRGFIFAAPLAYSLGAGFAPVRKLGRLPGEAIRVSYDLEYGSNTLEIHRDAIQPGQRVLIVDDLLATGGTVRATIQLVEALGGVVVGLDFLIELLYLRGREHLPAIPKIVSLITYS